MGEYMSKEIALERIKKAFSLHESEFDLSDLALEELPPEIGLLKNLKEINLSDNKLDTLPTLVSANKGQQKGWQRQSL